MSPSQRIRPGAEDPTADGDVAVPARRSGSRATALAAAAVLAIGAGVGGYVLGHRAGGDPDTTQVTDQSGESAGTGRTDPAEPRGASDRLLAGSDATQDPQGLEDGDSTFGGEDVGWFATSGAADSSYIGYDPEVLIPGDGLSTESPGTGEVTRLVLADIDPEDFIANVVEVLDLGPGQTDAMGDSVSWFSDDPEVWTSLDIGVYSEGWLNFSTDDDIVETCEYGLWEDDAELLEGEATAEGEVGGDDVGAATAAPIPQEAPAECDAAEVPVEEAEASAREFLDTIGLDSTAYTFTFEEDWTPSAAVRYFSVSLEGSDETSGAGQVIVTQNGVTSVNVQMPTEAVSLGEYPLTSPRDAVERYHDPRFQQLYVDTVQVYDGSQYSMWGDAEPTDIPEPEPLSPGDPIPAWVSEVVIEDAELITGSLSISGGTVQIPTYLLTGADGQVYAVPALAEEAFDFTR